MSPHFSVNFESSTNTSNGKAIICIRFYSTQHILLVYKRFCAYYDSDKCDFDGLAFGSLHLDNESVIKPFGPFSKTKDMYSSVSLVVMDKTNQEQYHVKVRLDKDSVIYNPMPYEVIP